MAPPPRCLRDSVAKDDDTWHFTIPHELLSSNQPGHGKMVQFKTVESGAKIMFQMAKFSNNRVIQNDDINEFVLVSFSLPGRQAEWTLKDGGEYISRFLERGLFINGVQYRFYHHSASQLVRDNPSPQNSSDIAFRRSDDAFCVGQIPMQSWTSAFTSLATLARS